MKILDLSNFNYFTNFKLFACLYMIIIIWIVYSRIVTKKVDKTEAFTYFIKNSINAIISALLFPFTLYGVIVFINEKKINFNLILAIMLICILLKFLFNVICNIVKEKRNNDI